MSLNRMIMGVGFGLGLLLAGCGGMSDTEIALFKARAAVENAMTNQAASYASERLFEAQTELTAAEDLAAAGQKKEAIGLAESARLKARQASALATEGRLQTQAEERAEEAAEEAAEQEAELEAEEDA
ncbi:MAG: hypothetical protein AAFU72_03375 [Pseudomonadota bacterium]